jgi:hypothetical protein
MKRNSSDTGFLPPTVGADGTGGWWAAWCRFWFSPRDAFGLHALRVMCGLLFLGWLLPFAGHVDAFFGLDGWYDTRAYKEASERIREERNRQAAARQQSPEEGQFLAEEMLPFARPSWSLAFLCGNNSAALQALYWSSIVVLLLYTLGVAPRVTSVLTFVIAVSFTANPALSYDADRWLPILVFYPMVGYLLLGQSWRGLSMTERLFGPRGSFLFSRVSSNSATAQGGVSQTSVAANLALRLLQVHFAFLIVMMGLDKLQVGDWWSGVSFWYWLNPPGTTWDATRTHRNSADSYLTFMSLAVYATLAWQIGFPLFAWRRGWRLLLLGGAVMGWIGLVVVCGLPLFGPILLIVCLSYLTPEEWERWLGFLRRFRPAALAVSAAGTDMKENTESASVSVS